MTLAVIGAAAIGAVGGWWSAPLMQARARLRTWGSIAAFVALLELQSLWLGGWMAALALLIGFTAGLAAHTGFRAALIARFAPSRRNP